MVKKASPEVRLSIIEEARHSPLDEIKHNDLMTEKYKKTCKYSNYVEHLLILSLTIIDCVSISAFVSLVCVPIGITNSAVGINICAVTPGIKKYKLI